MVAYEKCYDYYMYILGEVAQMKEEILHPTIIVFIQYIFKLKYIFEVVSQFMMFINLINNLNDLKSKNKESFNIKCKTNII